MFTLNSAKKIERKYKKEKCSKDTYTPKNFFKHKYTFNRETTHF